MSDQAQQRSQDSLRHEYAEVLQSYRHHSNLRFAAFSIFIAMMAGISLVAFGRGQFGQHASAIARVAGVLVVVMFWLYEERLSSLVQYFIGAAVKLERALGYTLWAERPAGKGHLPKRAVIMRAFYFVLALLWIYAAFAVPLDR
jgi:membrane associated rhomboid family serine protease